MRHGKDLLDATRRCVRHQGLARTTSRDITTEAEANLAAITYHFGSKDELVAEALLAGLREWLDPALAALADADDPATGCSPPSRPSSPRSRPIATTPRPISRPWSRPLAYPPCTTAS